ncbi:MAG TPA: phosphotransferase [Desulfobacterales bacterium]|nr:phosphotransferase [Desulfobacterales bacterium]
MRFVGRLSRKDPLYEYLRDEILPQLNIREVKPDFKVFRLPASNHVYLYKDRNSLVRVIGKFFGEIPNRSHESAFYRMNQEYNNLQYLRSLGFTGYPHSIARPLGHTAHLNFALIEEFCCGTPLHDFLIKAIREGAETSLYQKLTALAYFLATLHNRTVLDIRVDFNKDCSYFDRILKQLISWGYIGKDEAQEFYRLKDRWRNEGSMWEDRQVLVHGDVTPTNILFKEELWVIAVDLERMKSADRVFDVGRIAGEIKHYFMQHTGNKALAEPFIGHFLWEYACHFPDRQSAFDAVTRRLPFYMGLNLLRIARNAWIKNIYRRQLLEEAKMTLR